MAWFEVVFAGIFIAWMLKIAMKKRVSPTRDDWLGLFHMVTFVRTKRKYFKEKYLEQKGFRVGNQQLRENTDEGADVPDWMGGRSFTRAE